MPINLATLITDAADDPSKLNAIIAEIVTRPFMLNSASTMIRICCRLVRESRGVKQAVNAIISFMGFPVWCFCERSHFTGKSYFFHLPFLAKVLPDLWLISFDRLYPDPLPRNNI